MPSWPYQTLCHNLTQGLFFDTLASKWFEDNHNTFSTRERGNAMPSYELSVTFVDHYNRKCGKRFEIEAASFNDANTAAADLITDLDGALGIKVVKAALAQDISPATPETPDEFSNVDEGLSFKCVLAGGGNKAYTLKFPGPRKDYIGSTGLVDLDDADITALLADFTGALNPMRVSDGETIDHVVQGVLDAK